MSQSLAARASETAQALVDTMAAFADAVPGGWSRRTPGGLLMCSGVPVPTLNGLWLLESIEAVRLADLLAELADTGLPYCVQSRAAMSDRLSAVLAAGGYVREDLPLMRLDARDWRPPVDAPREVDVRRLAPSELVIHHRLAAEGFEAPEEVMALAASAEAVAHGASVYVGEIEGRPVTTGIAYRGAHATAIFNVATPPAHRRRGYGAALTAHAITEAFAAGAAWAWLQSSESGLRVYEALGFRTVEMTPCWTRAD